MEKFVNKIESILKTGYNTKQYAELVNELFPGVQFVAPDKFCKEYSNLSAYVEGYTHIGNYKTADGKNILLMSVRQKKARYVENARSSQRSYAKKLIESANADAAFIAFYTEGEPKWRLSFVRLDYEMKFENGRLKTAENMTPAKRYSFLVGEDEPCHTAISRFKLFITNSQSNPEYPTLDALEETFSVEKVTNEFFALYCEKFQQLREQLEANEDFCIEAEQHNFTSEQFAKKLMGQIVFLYFLQKKGWLGVTAWPDKLNAKEYKNAFFARGSKSRELIPIVYKQDNEDEFKVSRKGLESISDEDEAVLAQCVKGEAWGTGPHNFMRKLFEMAEKRNINFYDDVLEPLFYNALNVNRGQQGYCAELHCRIPFLSGGLFEPIDGYDWEHNDFNLPNSVFSNISEKGSREADGILDIFDRYNFTMSEDEPMEREVAIDPEMLGKVFENLLEVKDRKSKGAFYTPREIVHYMCQESLINYLTATLKVSEEAVRDFILYGDFMKDEDKDKEKRRENHGMYISEELYKLDNAGKVVVNRLTDMDKALQDVRIADPAVGSGAFPLGMLNEIVRARQNISVYFAITMKPRDTHFMYQFERSPYNLKIETIKNCIYAADVEPSAVDIAQLRLWLSLVIDDEINPDAQTDLDGNRNPLPLPNLECNILCGNSLIDELNGIRLIKESDILGDKEYQISEGQNRFESVVKKLIETQKELFHCDDTNKKPELLTRINDLKDIIVMAQLEGAPSETIEKYQASKGMASKPYILWQLDFARVFKEKGGFDIVIGNPPYLEARNEGFSDEIKIQLQSRLQRKYGRKQSYITRGSDLLIYFYELAISLINENGINTFITQNSWLDTDFGQKFQHYLLKEACPCLVLDTDFKQFGNSANINTIITIIKDKHFNYNNLAFVRLHKQFDAIYFSPFLLAKSIESEDMTVKVYDKKSPLLVKYKWGFVYNSPEFFLSLVDLLQRYGKSASEISEVEVSVGQGLNLKKSYIYDGNVLSLGINCEAINPIFTVNNNGVYSWNEPTNYIIDESKLDENSKAIVRDSGIMCYDGSKTSKVPPALIMPRGISNRYYSALNIAHGYSASYVDIYINDFENNDELTKAIWVFTNSTVFKLYREITGRNNLGGGMLKAEATDIKEVPIYFHFDVATVDQIYNQAKDFVSQSVLIDTQSEIQMCIDEVVYDYLKIDVATQKKISDYLCLLVNNRYSKSRT